MKEKIICAVLCVVSVFTMSVVYTYTVSEDLHDNIVRLHIIANSNSEYDQSLKLKIRDELTEKSRELKECEFDTEYMESCAKRILTENRAPYSAVCETGDFYFPEKRYANITMPEGTYKGVRIVLGEGQGENWWCVISPPMCFTKNSMGEADTDMLSERLNEDTIDVITDKNGINYKFKLVETIKKIIG